MWIIHYFFLSKFSVLERTKSKQLLSNINISTAMRIEYIFHSKIDFIPKCLFIWIALHKNNVFIFPLSRSRCTHLSDDPNIEIKQRYKHPTNVSLLSLSWHFYNTYLQGKQLAIRVSVGIVFLFVVVDDDVYAAVVVLLMFMWFFVAVVMAVTFSTGKCK